MEPDPLPTRAPRTSAIRAALDDLPTPLRWAIVAGATLSAIGAITGLIIGLFANPPTAIVALFELGIPATMIGAVLGLVAGSVALAIRRVRRPAG